MRITHTANKQKALLDMIFQFRIRSWYDEFYGRPFSSLWKRVTSIYAKKKTSVGLKRKPKYV